MLNKLSVFLIVFAAVSCTSRLEKKTVPGDFCSKISLNDSSSLKEMLAPIAAQMKTKTGVYVLEEGENSLIARAWLAHHAQKSIDIQYYIFSLDNSGLIACDYLVRAADRGVKVRVIIDDITFKGSSREINMLDSHENIEIKIYNPGVMVGNKIDNKMVQLGRNIDEVQRRMHNKTINVDDKAIITGGRNIADEYFDFDTEYNFRDRDVLLLGETASKVKGSFEWFWNDPTSVPVSKLVTQKYETTKDPNRFNALHQYACNPDNFSPEVRNKIKNFPKLFKAIQNSGELVWVDNVSFVADGPGKNKERKDRKGSVTTDSLIELIKSAKLTVDIQSSYLVLTEDGKKLFSEIVKRGVRVRVLTNSLASTDNHEAFSGYQRDRKEILETGIEVYEFKPDAAVRFKIMKSEVQAANSYTPVFGHHAKTMVIDGQTTVIGSFNMDPRSANLNSECVAIIRSKEISDQVIKHFEEEFLPENAWRITKDFNPDKEAGTKKRIKAATRRIVPKNIL